MTHSWVITFIWKNPVSPCLWGGDVWGGRGMRWHMGSGRAGMSVARGGAARAPTVNSWVRRWSEGWGRFTKKEDVFAPHERAVFWYLVMVWSSTDEPLLCGTFWYNNRYPLKNLLSEEINLGNTKMYVSNIDGHKAYLKGWKHLQK